MINDGYGLAAVTNDIDFGAGGIALGAVFYGENYGMQKRREL